MSLILDLQLMQIKDFLTSAAKTVPVMDFLLFSLGFNSSAAPLDSIVTYVYLSALSWTKLLLVEAIYLQSLKVKGTIHKHLLDLIFPNCYCDRTRSIRNNDIALRQLLLHHMWMDTWYLRFRQDLCLQCHDFAITFVLQNFFHCTLRWLFPLFPLEGQVFCRGKPRKFAHFAFDSFSVS